MKVTRLIGTIVVIGGLATGLDAQTPAPPAAPAAPNTLWHFLGIPQGCQKIKDACKNKKGDCPCKERKPLLKRIADPANLESQNPAIKAAAKIKAEEDLAPQKVKAIKYLAIIGCGCYPGVGAALLAALDDCTEEVRYQAAVAFYQLAGSPCQACDRNGCCSAVVMTKLEEMAHGQDEKGCYKESSPRVRQAAEAALNACRAKLPPSSAPVAPETPHRAKEVPMPARRESPQPPSGTQPQIPVPPPDPAPVGGASVQSDRGQPTDRATAQLQSGGRPYVAPVRAVGFAEAQDGSRGPQPPADSVAMARDWWRRCPPGGEPTICPEEQPGAGKAGAAAPGGAAPGAPGEAAPGAQAAPPSDALAGNYGAAAGPTSAAPNMIGDFFGGGARFFGAGLLGRVQNASVGIDGGDRRFKIDEDESPVLADRVFFDYNHFQNPVVDINGNSRNLESFTFGVEKTFRDGLWSVELRVPVSSDYNSTQSESGASLADTEFGDLALSVKRLLYRGDHLMVSTGLGFVFPTGQNWEITDPTGSVLCEEKNQSVHLQPFLGAVWQPSDRLFFIAFAQVDFDTGGNQVFAENSDGVLQEQGVFHEQNLAFADLAAGYWLFKDHCNSFITGMAPVVELHYNSTLQPEDFVQLQGPDGPLGVIGASPTGGNGYRNILDLTAGLHFQIGPKSTLTVAYVAPLGSGLNRDYDGEFAAEFNRRF